LVPAATSRRMRLTPTLLRSSRKTPRASVNTLGVAAFHVRSWQNLHAWTYRAICFRFTSRSIQLWPPICTAIDGKEV
jgi:hypothetical protein